MSEKYLEDADFDADDWDEEWEDNGGYECQAYPIDGVCYCPIAGTELCDWECKMGGAGWWEDEAGDG